MEKKNAQSGFTIIEVAVVSVLLTVVISGVYSLFGAGTDSYGSEMTKADLQSHADQVLDQIADELIGTGKKVIYPRPVPPYASPNVTFQTGEGFAEGEAQWGPITSIEFEYAPDEKNDGIDNNGNGLVDEGQVVWIENPGLPNQTKRVLTRWVREYLQGEVPNGKDDNGNGLIDERGLSFDKEINCWTIRLSLERQDSKHRTLRYTAETSILIRN